MPQFQEELSDLDFIHQHADQDVQQCALMIRDTFLVEGSGHDWWHIFRVWKLSIQLMDAEKINDLIDRKIGEISALLHDIADHKFHDGDLEIGPQQAYQWCSKNLRWKDEYSIRVANIVRNISFKGADVADNMIDPIGKLVQDADRLDAIGAIGIARTFAFGGYKKQPIYDPTIPAKTHSSFEDYKSNTTTTVNHFYEKLLLLKDRMHTKSAIEIARKRTQFMQEYLNEFYAEWWLN